LVRGLALLKREAYYSVIRRKDGQIQTEHTYGKDPFPPKG